MKRVLFRRKREGKTNYNKRLLMIGSRRNRLVTRILSNTIITQIIKYEQKGDSVLVSANTKELKDLGWKFSLNNTPAAYLMGYLLGTKAKKAKLNEAIFDIGLKTPIKKSKIFAVLKGAVDAGMNIPHSKEAFPDKNRLNGKFIEEYASSDNPKSDFQFKKSNSKNISSIFEEVKAKIK